MSDPRERSMKQSMAAFSGAAVEERCGQTHQGSQCPARPKPRGRAGLSPARPPAAPPPRPQPPGQRFSGTDPHSAARGRFPAAVAKAAAVALTGPVEPAGRVSLTCFFWEAFPQVVSVPGCSSPVLPCSGPAAKVMRTLLPPPFRVKLCQENILISF